MRIIILHGNGKELATRENSMTIDQNRLTRDQVEYITGRRNYTIIHLNGGRALLSSRTLQKVCDGLNLLRVHKKSAVNRQHVVGVSEEGVEMKSGVIIPIARRRQKEILGLGQ